MIVARRKLFFFDKNDKIDVTIIILAPQFDGEHWVCNYEIDWPAQKRVSSSAGIDSVQALHLALQKIGLDIYMSDYHASGRLFWEEIGSGYGFPVPKNGRDFLVGRDKEFEG